MSCSWLKATIKEGKKERKKGIVCVFGVTQKKGWQAMDEKTTIGVCSTLETDVSIVSARSPWKYPGTRNLGASF